MDLRVIFFLLAGLAAGALLGAKARVAACVLVTVSGIAYYASLPSPEEKGYGLFMSLPIFLALFAFGLAVGVAIRAIAKRKSE